LTPELTTRLQLNLSVFRPGDQFDLRLTTENPRIYSISADQYILLDVWGIYYFWPSWTMDVDYAVREFAADAAEEIILQFVWPSGAGAASDIGFWAALFHPGTYDFFSFDHVTFGFEEPVGPTATPTSGPSPTATATPTPVSSPEPTEPPSWPVTVTVPGDVQWTDTGIDVTAAGTWRIQGSGSICFHIGDCPGTTVGPCGLGTTPCYDPECGSGQPYQPGFYHGALIGRIDSGAAFLICPLFQGTMPANGRLYLGINDGNVSDNDGEFIGTIYGPGSF